jgi:AraC-like DNA-binding protein
MSKAQTFNYQEYLPAPKLRNFVECFWTLKGSSKGNKIIRETLVPGGRVEVIFSSSPFLWYGANKNAKAKSYSGSFLLGQRNSVSYVGFKGDFSLFGIRFRYGCSPLFIKYAAKNCSNRVVPLTELSIDNSPQIGKMDSRKEIRRFIGQVDNWLLSCFEDPTDDWNRLQKLIEHVSKQNIENIVLRSLYEKYGWSYKKAERVFLKYGGFPPRAFLKLFRFRNALEKMKGKPASFTDAAYQFGFYDQSHFIREFYRYTGSKPSSFFKNPPEIAILLYKLSR